MNKDKALRHLLNKLNKVTAYHRHGNPVPDHIMDDLANAQLDYEQAEESTYGKISIEAAKEVSEKYGLDQVILLCRHLDSDTVHHVTYGKTYEDCGMAAIDGKKIAAMLNACPTSLEDAVAAAKKVRPNDITGKPNSNGRDVNFIILEDEADHITIEDIGPWNIYLSVTNGVEQVIAELAYHNALGNRRLLYVDSEGRLDEILHEDGKFVGFKPLPQV